MTEGQFYTRREARQLARYIESIERHAGHLERLQTAALEELKAEVGHLRRDMAKRFDDHEAEHKEAARSNTIGRRFVISTLVAAAAAAAAATSLLFTVIDQLAILH